LQVIDPKHIANSKSEDKTTTRFKKLMTSHTGHLDFLQKKISPGEFNNSKTYGV